MVNIKQICLNLDNELNKNDTKEVIMEQCVSEKLSMLYTMQSNQLDCILNELSKSIDVNDIEYTYKVIKRLSKNLTNNRKQLMRLIEEVNCHGKV